MLILIANASCDSQSYTNKKERKFTKDVLISSSAGGTSLTASLDPGHLRITSFSRSLQ